MATANGTLAAPSPPPAPTSPSLAKRKLTGSHAIVANGASVPAQAQAANANTQSLQAVLQDITTVVKSYDTQPPILSHPLSSSITRTSSGEADSKRTKLTPPTGSTTIASLVQEGSYDSLQSFEKDVETASSEILASSGGSDATTTQGGSTEAALQAKVLAFRAVVRNLVDREEARRAHLLQAGTDVKDHVQQVTKESSPVPIKEEEPQALPSRTVLTLYGSAPPKQLFSSLQQPQKVGPSEPIATLDTAVRVTLPLRENNLPNILSTTEVFPLPDPADQKAKKTTIGEVFRAPAHLAQISPPKSARPSTAKGNSTITFAHQETPKPRRKGSQSYSHQALSAGSWLGYGGVDMPKDQTSPTAKQKNRQRALSMGEAQQPPSEAILVAVQQAKEEALFRSVYSSFAPTRDDASAIIPEQTKNMIWWQKVGEKRFNETFPIDPALLDADAISDIEANGTVDEEESFKEAVEKFVPMNSDIFPDKEKSEEEKDTDEVLKEISELLETLASYQRIRNLSLTTNPRTPMVQNASLATLAGSPLTPSSEEIDVYQILKSQLTLLISQLPPYAVAKLNGDQMDELNISRTILFDTKEYKGVMEEDQLSRLAKAPPAVAPTPATLTRASSGAHTHVQYTQTPQYSRPAASTHQSSSRPAYSQQQSLHRSSSMHLQRSPSGPSQAFQANYGSTPRPGYAATPSYNQQSRPSYGTLASGQYYSQRSAQPSSYTGATGSQFYSSTPQTQPQNRYTGQQGQNGFYPPRSQNVAPMYNGAQVSQPRTASPLKAAPAPSQSAFGARTAHGTPVSGGQMRSTYYGPSQYGTPQAPAPSTPFASGAANPQQVMMERQQAQAVAQSQARLAAQSSFSSRQGSGTPQPPNGVYGSQNGT